MKKIEIVDVRTRLRNIPENEMNFQRSNIFREQAEKAIQSNFPSKIIFCIESGIGDTSVSMSEDTMFNLYEALAEVGTESQVRKYGNLILKEYVSKTRDAQETQKYLKQRMGRAKSKITSKIQNNVDDLWSATNSTIGTAKDNFKKNTEPFKNALANTKTRAKMAGKKITGQESALIEAYENMVQYATNLVSIDRILENYNRISKRFNIDRIIQENTAINGAVDTAIIICGLVETYDMPVKARYNTCLETVWYGLHKNGFTFNEQDTVTAISDFYMAKGGNSFACKSILEASIVFDKGDYRGDIDIITEEEPEDDDLIQETNDPTKDLFKRYGIKDCLDEIRPKVKDLADKSEYKKRIKVTTGYKANVEEKYIKWYICDYADNWNFNDDKDLIDLFDKFADMVSSYISKNKSEFELGYEKDDDDFIAIYLKVPNETGIIESYIHEIEFKNDKGEEVPKKCPKCGSKVGVFFRGEPVFLCTNDKCKSYFGTVPFKETSLYQYMVEGKLSSKERKNLKDSDYGIPSKRKYPMPDESHVRSAIQMFNHVDPSDEAELAKNIKKMIRRYGMSVDVGKDNRFSKYYKPENENAIIISAIREYSTNDFGFIVENDTTDFDKIFNDYKMSNDTNKQNKLMTVVRKLYTLSPKNIVDGTPNFLSYLRTILVIGGFAIQPVIGVIAFIADQIVSMHMKREDTAEIREVFKSEIRKVDKKIASTKSQSEKDNLQKYRDSLGKAYDSIDQYYESLLTDQELDAKYDAADDDDIKIGGSSGDSEFDKFEDMFDDDFDFDDMDDMGDLDGFEESGKFVILMGHLLENYEDNGCEEKTFDKQKCRKMIKSCPSIVGDLVKVAKEYPQIISKHDLLNAIDNVRSDVQIGSVHINMIERFEMDNAYTELSQSENTIMRTSDIFEEATRFGVQISITRALNEIYSACIYYSPVTEASFTNSLKLASEKLKKGMKKLSDKDKTISKNIDVSLNSFAKSVERAMTNDRRDAIIKGSVIPSASKLIKGAILTGVTGIVLGPAIAVIGVLGYLGVSKSLNNKQRKALLDEIEIELKMCQKYIDLAESKNDLKSLKKLYSIQRELEKQKGKIKYHLITKGEKFIDPGNLPNSTYKNAD